MEQVCVHCGQSFEINADASAGTVTCPACGKPTPTATPSGGGPGRAERPTVTQPSRSRIKARDILIVLAVLALLAILALLFLKPKQPARDLVFGDLGARPASTNIVATTNVTLANPTSTPPPVVGRSASQTVAPFGRGSNGGVGVNPRTAWPGDQVASDQASGNSNSISVGGNSYPSALSTSAGSGHAPPLPGFVSNTAPITSTTAISTLSPSPAPSPTRRTAPVPTQTTRAPSINLPRPPPQPASGSLTARAKSTVPLMDTASTPESGTSERTADLLAAAKDSSPAEPDKAPIKTADLLAADVVSTAGSPGNRKATGTGKGADNAAESPTPTATTKAAPPTDSQPAAPPPLDDEGGLDGMTNEVPTNVFNSPGPASNVVFILDHSLSMKNNHKSIVARHELVNTLETMNPAQKFYVMFFHSGGFVGMPTPGPVDATPENIHAMTNWLFSVGHKFGSDPTIAVKNALGLVPTPDTLWLLSNGKFSAKAVAAIRDSNDLNVHINTIGFYSRQGEQTLRQIAEENRGTYRFIPPPAPTAARAPDGNSP